MSENQAAITAYNVVEGQRHHINELSQAQFGTSRDEFDRQTVWWARPYESESSRGPDRRTGRSGVGSKDKNTELEQDKGQVR
jgi:hypothetical protein